MIELHSRTLHIFYRHVHIKSEKRSRDPSKRRPEWFSYEKCFRNLLQTIRLDPLASNVKLLVVYDGDMEDFRDDFISNYYANESLGIKLQFIQGGSEPNSNLITLFIARSAEILPNDLIYFLENDYMHQVGWVSKLLELYSSGLRVDYASLYDHKDKYFLQMYSELTSKIFCTNSHHWRTAPSTCGSFVVERSIYEQDYDILQLGIPDFFLFTKLLNERQRVLVTPIPGLSTHMMEGYLSPAIQWQNLVY